MSREKVGDRADGQGNSFDLRGQMDSQGDRSCRFGEGRSLRLELSSAFPTMLRSASAPYSARNAFTLIEALAALTVAAIAGSVLLLGATTSIRSTDDALRQTIAYGMAQQLMDEVVGCQDGDSTGVGSRSQFTTIADFNGYRSQPPTDSSGVALGADDGQGGQRNAAFRCDGSYLGHWRQEVDVYYVSDSDWTTKTASGDYRAVEVRITYNDPTSGSTTLATIRRIVSDAASLDVN
ncbi:MAG: type II secretion system protein [Thermoguttaceae bacterium]